jgi:DNA-binding transcriptional regulator YdaS (Cro superfamily)
MSLTLLEFCAAADVTIPDIARQAGVDAKWLYKVAKGERGCSMETAAKIEKATLGKVTPSDLTRVRMAWIDANPDRPDRARATPKKSVEAEAV